MPTESPSKWQVQAYRFGVRRLESAVTSGDALLRSDGGRRRISISVIVSVVVTALAVGVVTVYGFIRPEPTIGKAKVVIDSDSGGVYVAQGGRLYPALNLASALLAAGRGQRGNSAPEVTTVNSSTIAHEPRGQTIGIPGAPDTIPGNGDLVAPRWMACDTTTHSSSLPPSSPPQVSTTAILGSTLTHAGSFGNTGGALVSADGTTDYLLWAGRRSRIDPTDPAIALAFGLTDAAVRPISLGLLDAIPESAPITVPTFTQPATTPSWASALGVTVGTVFALREADGRRAIYVALDTGVQQITPLVGDLLRAQDGVLKDVPLVVPSVLRAAPAASVASRIPLDQYPATRLVLAGTDQYPVLCVVRPDGDPADLLARAALPLPHGAKPVPVTARTQLTADAVYLRPGTGAVLGDATSAQDPRTEPLFLVTDDGVRYPVASGAALASLGLGKKVSGAPPELLQLLPLGPTLDPAAAANYWPTARGALPLPTAAAG